MNIRVVAGVAGIAASALAAFAIVRSTMHRDAPAPTTDEWHPLPAFEKPDLSAPGSGVDIAQYAAGLISDHDKNHDGHVDLSPKPFDKDIQERLPAATADALAVTDERITDYRGDVTGSDGRDLHAHSELKLMMAAAQSAAQARGEALDDRLLGHLQLTQPDLEREIARQFDVNGDGRLQTGEAHALQAKYPGEGVNYRWVRVLHLGEWMGTDPSGPGGASSGHED